MNYLEDLHEMCETLARQIGEANDKVRGGKLSGSDLDYVDKLTHALKSVKTTIAMMEAEEGSSGYYPMRGSYNGNSYGNGGSYARRDSMGRYTRGYSRDDDMISELRSLMGSAPDERTKQEFQRFIEKIERM